MKEQLKDRNGILLWRGSRVLVDTGEKMRNGRRIYQTGEVIALGKKYIRVFFGLDKGTVRRVLASEVERIDRA